MCVGMVCNRTENVNNILMHEFIRNFELIDKKIQLRLASLHTILNNPKSIKGKPKWNDSFEDSVIFDESDISYYKV